MSDKTVTLDKEAPILCHPELASYSTMIKKPWFWNQRRGDVAVLHALIVVASELRQLRIEGIPEPIETL